jgi:hypothetical protein
VMNKHSWSSVPHDLSDFLLHIGLIAVDNAFAACAFFVLKWAFVKAHKCICLEFYAFCAKLAVSSMMSFAVNFGHVTYCFLFSFHSFMFRVRWLRLHVNESL